MIATAVIILIAGLAVWMGICAWCGYGQRFVRFLAVLIAGLALNMLWLLIVLNTTPLEPHAITELIAATMYALCAFGCGWLVGRLVRQFRESRVESDGV